MNKNESQLTLYLKKKQTPKTNNLVLIINDGVSKGRHEICELHTIRSLFMQY